MKRQPGVCTTIGRRSVFLESRGLGTEAGTRKEVARGKRGEIQSPNIDQPARNRIRFTHLSSAARSCHRKGKLATMGGAIFAPLSPDSPEREFVELVRALAHGLGGCPHL
jgi:hypothetical protein